MESFLPLPPWEKAAAPAAAAWKDIFTRLFPGQERSKTGPEVRLLVLPALRHRHLVAAVIKLILRVVFPSGLPDGSPFSLVPLRAE